MAISPVSDLILDVARAADPQKAAAASRALNSDAPQADFASANFSRALSSATPRAQASVDGGQYAYRNSGATVTQAMSPAKKAAVGLETVLLKSLVEEMMPKNAPDVFGEGTSGDVWRSMLADKISEEVAKSGALHIADRLFATHRDLLQPSTVNKIKPALPPIEQTRIRTSGA